MKISLLCTNVERLSDGVYRMEFMQPNGTTPVVVVTTTPAITGRQYRLQLQGMWPTGAGNCHDFGAPDIEGTFESKELLTSIAE